RRDRVPGLRGREQHQRRDTAGRQRLVSSVTTWSIMRAKRAAPIRRSRMTPTTGTPEPDPEPDPGHRTGVGLLRVTTSAVVGGSVHRRAAQEPDGTRRTTGPRAGRGGPPGWARRAGGSTDN